jgi:protein-tyrosine phosphatase
MLWEFHMEMLGWTPSIPEGEDYKYYGFTHYLLPSPDHESLSLETFIKGINLMDSLLSTPESCDLTRSVGVNHSTSQEGSIIINCKSGKGRSVSLVMAWLLKHKYVSTTEEAYEFVASHRPQISMTHLQIQGVEFYRQYLLTCSTQAS